MSTNMSENPDVGDGVGLRNVGWFEQINAAAEITWAVNMNHRASLHGAGIKIMALWKVMACS